MAGGVIVAVAAVMGVAAILKPDARGLGTHCQLGFPPCALMLIAGIPCPTCGMTTAFAHTVRGQWLSALRAQPFGFLLAIGLLLLAGTCVYIVGTGRRVEINWYRLPPPRLAIVITALFLCAWGFKIAVHLAQNS